MNLGVWQWSDGFKFSGKWSYVNCMSLVYWAWRFGGKGNWQRGLSRKKIFSTRPILLRSSKLLWCILCTEVSFSSVINQEATSALSYSLSQPGILVFTEKDFELWPSHTEELHLRKERTGSWYNMFFLLDFCWSLLLHGDAQTNEDAFETLSTMARIRYRWV